MVRPEDSPAIKDHNFISSAYDVNSETLIEGLLMGDCLSSGLPVHLEWYGNKGTYDGI